MKLNAATPAALRACLGATLVLSLCMMSSSSVADTAPVNPADPKTPETVAVDVLPTAQINGVVWSQAVVGNIVYAVGRFTQARPAGAAAGVGAVTRSNAVAYDIRTGVMTSWAPSLNAQGLAVAASPDGTRIYIGGDFTQVNGQVRNRIAAVSPTTGAPIASFAPNADSKVRAIVTSGSTVYFGGLFTRVNNVSRQKVAAVRGSDGGLTTWAPNLAGGGIWALAASPDGTKVVLGGNFTTLNGGNRPGYGLGMVNASTGASLPFAVNNVIRNGGSNAAITGLSGDSDSVYGTGYVYGGGGNFEGAFRARWTDGGLNWLEDCHGDSYAPWARGADVYVVSHAHYCGNVGGFPEGPARRATAFSKVATGTVARNAHGNYANFQGNPAPSLLHFYPDLLNSTFTGQGQAAWHVTGNSTYVVMGGEFPRVNGAYQQGLVRFAVKSVAPNKRGGVLTGSKLNPTLTAMAGGTIQVTWPANWDMDNKNLTYKVIRDGNTAAPIYQTKRDSSFWQLPRGSFLDTGRVPGTAYRYRVFSSDAFGNETRSDTVTVTAR